MARLSQIPRLVLFVVVLCLAGSATAFTPDAAFKMKSLGISANPKNDNNANKMRGPAQQPAFGNDRNMQLSLIGQENIRKSITVPPAYEDYMAVRQLSLMRLLGRND
jgi:hypothetical protein